MIWLRHWPCLFFFFINHRNDARISIGNIDYFAPGLTEIDCKEIKQTNDASHQGDWRVLTKMTNSSRVSISWNFQINIISFSILPVSTRKRVRQKPQFPDLANETLFSIHLDAFLFTFISSSANEAMKLREKKKKRVNKIVPPASQPIDT